MNALVGWTGFIGLELLSGLDNVERYNSKNIDSMRGKVYDCVYFAGLPAEKWKINKQPDADRQNLQRILDVLKSVTIQRLVLISTVDVLDCSQIQDETGTNYSTHAYGVHRRMMEEWVQQNIADHYILRLPGLFGKGLKKNIVYDLIFQNQMNMISPASVFQWYDIHDIHDDINTCVKNSIRLLHLVSEPIPTSAILSDLFPESASVCTGHSSVQYILKTHYRNDGYWTTAQTCIYKMSRYILYERSIQSLTVTPVISAIAWEDEQTTDMMRVLDRYRIRNLEVALTKFAGWDTIEDTLETLLKRHCVFSSCQSILYNTDIEIFVSPQRFVEHYKLVARCCILLGIKTIVFGSPKQRHSNGTDIIPYFREIASISRNAGVVFCLEPNSSKYGCTWIRTIKEAIDFLDEVGEHDVMKLNVDTGNYAMESDTFVFDSTTVSRIGHVQVSNEFLSPLTTIPEGSKQLIQTICREGYSGTISLEMRPTTTHAFIQSMDTFIALLVDSRPFLPL
jgi:sugar phosphate isomerase/epimerase